MRLPLTHKILGDAGAVRTLSALKALGLRLSLDDFGTGRNK